MPRPVGVAWRNEWAALTLHWAQITNQKHFKPWLAKISVVEACEHTHSDMIEGSIAAGWPREDATCYWLLQSRVAGLSHALRDRNPAFSASLHALTDLLHAAARPTARNQLPASRHCGECATRGGSHTLPLTRTRHVSTNPPPSAHPLSRSSNRARRWRWDALPPLSSTLTPLAHASSTDTRARARSRRPAPHRAAPRRLEA